METTILTLTVVGILVFSCTAFANQQDLFRKPSDTVTRWTSFENPLGRKGEGGQENQGAKGHAFDSVNAREAKTLLDVEGAGIITRMWITINDRSPERLRSLRLEMFWDDAKTPAVSVPFGDFFGVGLGQCVPFECEIFSNPEGKSFNCCIPMPFRTAARIVVTNDSDKKLTHLFYDINYLLTKEHSDDVLYFHAHWRRENPTQLERDFEILPRVKGKGRFLGTNIGVVSDPRYGTLWWGEGEVKVYLDSDKEFPSLVGTGTEDYIGTGWGQGTFDHAFQGSLVADKENGHWAFYRYHIPDPIYFDEDCRFTIQQMGGGPEHSQPLRRRTFAVMRHSS